MGHSDTGLYICSKVLRLSLPRIFQAIANIERKHS